MSDKTYKKVFSIEDLRGFADEDADFKLTYEANELNGRVVVFFRIYNEDELSLVGYKGNDSIGVLIPSAIEGFPVTRIDDAAFSDSSVSGIVLPNEVREIGREAFSGCTALREMVIPNRTTVIGRHAFAGCVRLREVVIPKSVSLIESRAFDGCTRLERIRVDENNRHFDSRKNCNAIIETYTNTLLQGCAQTIIPATIEKIGSHAMSKCCCGTSMIIPSGVTEIGEEAFSFCNDLEELVIPDTVTTVGKDAFLGCKNLRKIFVKNSAILRGSGIETLQKHQIVDVISANPVEFDRNQLSKEKLTQRLKSVHLLNSVEASKFGKEFNLEKAFGNAEDGKAKQEDKLSFYDRAFSEINGRSVDYSGNVVGEVYFEALENNVFFHHSDYPFIKYLNVFNDAKGQFGEVGFYSDFIHGLNGVNKLLPGKKLVTNRIDEICFEQEGLFSSFKKLETGLFKEASFLADDNKIFEYSSVPEKPLLDNDYYAIRLTRSLEDDYLYLYSDPLNRFFGEESSNDMFSKDGFNELLKNMDACYGIGNNGVTNVFLLFGMTWSNNDDVFAEFDKYALRANIGIDRRKGSEDAIKSFLKELYVFVKHATQHLISLVKDYQKQQTARKAAVNLALNRNFRHNIGSHVYNHLTADDAYHRIAELASSNSYGSCYGDLTIDSGNQLARFNKYVKNRMDYIPEMAFGATNVLTSRFFYTDVFREFDQVRLLLNYISGVSGFKYSFCLRHNGAGLSNENDIAIAFPGDVMGNQAFYNIVENVIRNTAKHARNDGQEVVVFTIDFIDVEDAPDYYCVEIDNGIPENDIDGIVRDQNERINSSILDEENELRSHSLGLLEMEAATAFLRQVDITKIDSYEYRFDEHDDHRNKFGNLILLKAIMKNGALGYRFFLQKPKEFLFLGAIGNGAGIQDRMAKEGIRFIGEEDFAKALDRGKSFLYPFLFCLEHVSNRTKALLSDDSDYKTLLPMRKLVLSPDEIREIETMVSSAGSVLPQLKEFAWKKYFHEWGIEGNDIYIGEVVGRKKYNNCRQVVFANHANNESFQAYWGNRTQLPELWVDNLSSYTQSQLPVFSQYASGSEEPLTCYVNSIPQWLKMEIFEAYHNKVVVLDERVQHFALETYEGSSKNGGAIPAVSLFESTNVVIPTTSLDPVQFDDRMVSAIESFIGNEAKDAFLLVHYGVLERMYKTERTITERLEEWAKTAKRVVVTSGRGSHSLHLPNSVCFANLSSVLNAFTENRCKFSINCLMNQSRRKNE